MPKSLGEWQWIDLQHRIQHHCAEFDHELPVTDLAEPCRRSPFSAMPAISGSVTIIAFTVIAVLLLSIFTLRKNSNFPAPTATVGGDNRDELPSQVETLPAQVTEQLRKQRQEQHEWDMYRYSGPLKGMRPPSSAIRLQTGKFAITPPDGGDGAIYALSKSGDAFDRKIIPCRLPAVLPSFDEAPIPWWYTYRGFLIAALAFVAVITSLLSLVRSRRKRARETLNITMDYLGRITGQT